MREDVTRDMKHSDQASSGSIGPLNQELSPLLPDPPNHAITPNVAKSKLIGSARMIESCDDQFTTHFRQKGRWNRCGEVLLTPLVL